MKILFIVSAPPKSRYPLTKVQGLAKLKAFDSEDGSVRFGEMTFTSATGTCRWDPPETDLMMGALFKLPEAADQE